MAAAFLPPDAGSDIEPYRLHVSQRWLDLTKQKLELARVPRNPPGAKSDDQTNGVSKDELVSLLDYWQETYDHRAQEIVYNNLLPQYRTSLALPNTTLTGVDLKVPNIHFVHRRSSDNNALPLLFCHDWGSSFIEVARVIEGLCEPISTPTPIRSAQQAFHVVCPSIPGFGFSDASPDANFGLEGTADILDALMRKVGYEKYMLHGSKWGFLVCRTITLRHPNNCIAVHTAGVEAPPPYFRHAPLSWMSYQIARLTKARFPTLSFGYIPSDFESGSSNTLGQTPQAYHSPLEALEMQSQTLDYALADSPTGLLALMLDLIWSTNHPPSRSKSSTLDLPLQEAWSPSEIIFWTMLYWLPGPEAPLRWLRSAARQTAHTSPFWRRYSPVPLGVSHFRGSPPPAWSAVYQKLCWVRRHSKEVRRPAWEASEFLVMDLRAFAEEVVGKRRA